MRGNGEAGVFAVGIFVGWLAMIVLVLVFGRVNRETIDEAISKCNGQVTAVYLRGAYDCEFREVAE